MLSKEEVLKRGYIDVKVFVSGLRQSHRMQVVYEKTPHGMVPFLVSKHYIPTPELIRLAEETQLPVKCGTVSVFPKGKMASHFATVQPETIEAEVEED